MARLILYAFCAGAGAFVALVALVIASGQTFGQRCARAYPDNPPAAERCVDRLAHGNRL